MKKKLKKDWFGRLKNKDEIHHDSKGWISEIEFINDEMRFLENLLSTNYIDFIESGFSNKIKELTTLISEEKSKGKTLYKIIVDHEKTLSELIITESVESNLHYLEIHEKLEREIDAFFKKYKKLKKDVYVIVEKVMEKKVQKKLI